MAEPQEQTEVKEEAAEQTVEVELALALMFPQRTFAEVTWSRTTNEVALRSVKYAAPTEPTREELEPSVQEVVHRGLSGESGNPALQALADFPPPPWPCSKCELPTNRISHLGKPVCPACKPGDK